MTMNEREAKELMSVESPPHIYQNEVDSPGLGTIEDRMIALLAVKNKSHGFWVLLAEKTGIVARRWRNLYARGQSATSDMIEALAAVYPEHALWFVTGSTVAANAQVAPSGAEPPTGDARHKTLTAVEPRADLDVIAGMTDGKLLDFLAALLARRTYNQHVNQE